MLGRRALLFNNYIFYMKALGSLFYRLGDTFLPLGVLLLVLGTQKVDGTPEAFLWVMAGFGLAFLASSLGS